MDPWDGDKPIKSGLFKMAGMATEYPRGHSGNLSLTWDDHVGKAPSYRY